MRRSRIKDLHYLPVASYETMNAPTGLSGQRSVSICGPAFTDWSHRPRGTWDQSEHVPGARKVTAHRDRQQDRDVVSQKALRFESFDFRTSHYLRSKSGSGYQNHPTVSRLTGL